MSKVFALPHFLQGRISQAVYVRWLSRKAHAHLKRDRKRSTLAISGSAYRHAIHAAVCASDGADFYTGEPLEWEKLSTYCNNDSKAGRSTYKAAFALLPTVDHVLSANGVYEFVICGWRTNDAKSDLCHADFLALCRRVISHHDAQNAAS